MPRNRKRTGSSAASQVPRSKAGCWTCRIRRKRCDEQADDLGTCQACRRLDIECLGWGSRRPEWCRDKDALATYKLNLKKKLCSRAGTRPSAKSRAAAAARSAQEGGPSTSLAGADADADVDGIDGDFDAELDDADADRDGDGAGAGAADDYEFEGAEGSKAPSGESPRGSRGSSRSVQEDLETADNIHAVKDFYYSSRHHRTNSNATNVSNVSGLSGFTNASSFDAFSSPTSSFSPGFSPQSPLSVLFSPHAQINALPILSTHHHQTAKTHTQIMSSLAARLRQLLPVLSVPHEYAQITSQILDLHDLKNAAFHSSSEREVKVAQQARNIETELNRLTHRASFDGLLSNAIGLGLGFDFTAPSATSYLSPSSAVSSTHGGVNMGLGVDNVYGSPMAMWSPDLISDSMSTFSGGSSAPTSPAMNGPMNNGAASFGDLFGFDPTPATAVNTSNDPWFNSMNMSMGGLDLGLNFGALGLSNDNFGSIDNTYGAGHVTTASVNAPSIALFPPVESAIPKPSPLNSRASTIVANTVNTTTVGAPAADPFQIHHETCTLLLQAILNSPAITPSTLFDGHFSNFTGFNEFNEFSDYATGTGSNSAPVEESLQRMVSKISSIFPTQHQHQRGVHSEYLFAATVAGALSSTIDRRAFFKRVVDSIESRLGTNVCATTLNEAWA